MSPSEEIRRSETESLCPECLARIPAVRVSRGDAVYMDKRCPEHGEFQSVLWRGEPSYAGWARTKVPAHPRFPHTFVDRGCPLDCGLCPDHRQQTCTGLLEITQQCDLRCPVCYADSGLRAERDPDLGQIQGWYRTLLDAGHACNVQLSGGEPTLRDDLPEIVALGRSMGFPFIQVNTNGRRMAQEPAFVERLKEAGLSSVFLQFDGTEDAIHHTLRGAPLSEIKASAIGNCEQQELGVVLVVTAVPGVNLGNIGPIIRLALDHIPIVRGVHFQPVSYFGRYPGTPTDENRVTIPEIIREIEKQTAGLVKAESFKPPGCENAFCSFHGNFVVMPGGELVPLTEHASSCGCQPTSAEEGASRSRDFVMLHWSAPARRTSAQSGPSFGTWDALLQRARTHMLCISGMAFQDAWNLDLDRLRECCIHVVSPKGKLVPFCAYNLTSASGRALYRRSV
jgi:7,8-dihydro-6-hydroxymethylpterin dimethyltransferase